MTKNNSGSKGVGGGNRFEALDMMHEEDEEDEVQEMAEEMVEFDETMEEGEKERDGEAEEEEEAEEAEEAEEKEKTTETGKKLSDLLNEREGYTLVKRPVKSTRVAVMEQANARYAMRAGGNQYQYTMRVEVAVKKGEVVNPQSTMQWLVEQMWKIDRNTAFTSSKEGADERDIIRVNGDYPLGQRQWRHFFEYADKDLQNGGMRITMAMKVSSKTDLAGFKKPYWFLQALRDRNVFIASHTYKTLEMKAMGFIVGKNEDTVDKARYAKELREALEGMMHEITIEGENKEVPMFEVNKKRVMHDYKDERGRTVETIDTTALEIRCEKETSVRLREILMEANERLNKKIFGTVVPFSMQSQQDGYVQMMSDQNEFIARRCTVYINGVSIKMMNAKILNTEDGKESLKDILLKHKTTRNDDGYGEEEYETVESVDPHTHADDFGQHTIITSLANEDSCITLVDKWLAELRKTEEIKELKGQRFFESPRRISNPISGNPHHQDKVKEYANRITAKSGEKRNGIIKTRPYDKIRGVILEWNIDRNSGATTPQRSQQGVQGTNAWSNGASSLVRQGIQNNTPQAAGMYRDNISLTGSNGTLGSDAMTAITKYIDETNESLKIIKDDLTEQKEQLKETKDELVKQREENEKQREENVNLRLQLEKQRLEYQSAQLQTQRSQLETTHRLEQMQLESEKHRASSSNAQMEMARLLNEMSKRNREEEIGTRKHRSRSRNMIKASVRQAEAKHDDDMTVESGKMGRSSESGINTPIKESSKQNHE